MKKIADSGFTLIELMVAISIASIVTLGIEQLLDTALSSWRIAIDEVSASKISEELANRLAEGDYEVPGLKDAVEILKAEETLVDFVPMWSDLFDHAGEGGAIKLTKQVRAGAPLPIGEIKFKGAAAFKMYPLSLEKDSNSVSFGFPIPSGSIIRITYHPDVQSAPELVMRYEWSPKDKSIHRYYDRSVSDFELGRETAKLTSVRFTYFDGSNRRIDLSGERNRKKASLLKRISAVKIELTFQGKEVEKDAVSFINIRALGKGGPGTILEEGMEIPLPSSENIRLLHLTNFTGVKEGQVVELRIFGPKKDRVWCFKMDLGAEPEGPVVRHYAVYYPENQMVYEHSETLSLAGGADLLSLDDDGRFDYDLDEGVSDQIKFAGESATLSVSRCDPEGVTLIVRP